MRHKRGMNALHSHFNGFFQTDLLRTVIIRYLQEAQLSQKGRAMLCVVKNFAKLFKIMRNYTLEYVSSY